MDRKAKRSPLDVFWVINRDLSCQSIFEPMSQANFVNPFQSFNRFFQRWWSTHWKSTLVLFFLVYLPLQITLILTLEIWHIREGGLSWDTDILLAIHSTVRPSLDRFALIFTKLGTTWGVFPAAIALMLAMLLLRQRKSLTYLLITLPGSAIVNRVAKAFMHRARPSLWESTFPHEPDFAFPSGHAMSSMVFVAVLVILTWGSRWCWFVTILGGLFVVTIGWTRLYLGVHYPSDILAGWMIALAWAVGVNWILNIHAEKIPPFREETTLEEGLSQDNHA